MAAVSDHMLEHLVTTAREALTTDLVRANVTLMVLETRDLPEHQVAIVQQLRRDYDIGMEIETAYLQAISTAEPGVLTPVPSPHLDEHPTPQPKMIPIPTTMMAPKRMRFSTTPTAMGSCVRSCQQNLQNPARMYVSNWGDTWRYEPICTYICYEQWDFIVQGMMAMTIAFVKSKLHESLDIPPDLQRLTLFDARNAVIANNPDNENRLSDYMIFLFVRIRVRVEPFTVDELIDLNRMRRARPPLL